MNKNIKVSICVVTYNQDKYIRECLQTLVNQKLDFNFEIIVGDDCSTDKTRDIILEFSKMYPELIFPLFQNTNVGAAKNGFSVYERARGEYIAHVDGDDAALPNKISKQVAILDANPHCFFCTHDAIVIDNHSNRIRSSLKKRRSGIYSIADLYKELPFFTHSTKMFRNNLDKGFYEKFSRNAIDIEVHVDHAKQGDIYHIDEPLCLYRVFTGMSSHNKRVNTFIVEANRSIYENAILSKPEHLSHSELKKAYAKAMLKFSYQSAFMGQDKDCFNYIVNSIKIKPYTPLQFIMLILSKFPVFLHKLIRLRASRKGYQGL